MNEKIIQEIYKIDLKKLEEKKEILKKNGKK